MSSPSDKQLTAQVHSILVKAYETDSLGDHSKRKIREMLADHFDVDLEHRKKTINQIVDEQNALVSANINSKAAESSGSASPVKKKTSKPETSPKVKAAKSGSKRKKASSEVEDDDEEDEDESYNDNAVAAAASTSASSDIGSDSDTTEAEQFSELEEDTSHHSRKKPKKSSSKSTTSKKSSLTRKPSSSSAKSASAAGGSEAEQRLTRLKKLVTECGVRKQWKKLYQEAGVGETDFKAQCNVVQSVLKDLGMTGKGSVEQARKIREEREFADELAALQENEVLGRSTRGARKATGRASMKKADDDDDDEGQASDFEESSTKKQHSRRTKVVADDEDSEDEGPRKKTFKSSLASFAADLNSDSD
ncbi:DEK_C domain-containing protein [Pseudozyma hubeiensis]|nr:DEK_C domain-containing protein [Pseudozyma hubeiensis]